MNRYLPILAVQAGSRSPETNLDEFENELNELLTDFPHAKMVIYPEIHLCGVSGTPDQRTERLFAAAEPMNGPRMNRLAAIAGRLGVWLLPGTVCELDENRKLFNSMPCFSPEGSLIASYRKCFPWRPFEPYTPGRDFTVFNMRGIGRIGLAVCYDIWFPEVVRQLAWMGAEVIVNPAQTSTCDRAKELVLLQANAICNQVYIVSVNAAAPSGTGQSVIVDPEGNIRIQLPGETPGIMTDVLNLDEVDRVRKYGTLGLNRMWSQFREDDTPLELSVYDGRMDPERWAMHCKEKK